MINTAIVIVNWNGEKLLKDCFDSLRSQTYKNFKIIFVDNGSVDGSVVFVEKNYPEAEIIKLPKNTGFAYPNNLAIKKAFENPEIEYIITLNNDALPERSYIEKLIECAERHPEAGSIQPKLLNYFDRSKIDNTGIFLQRDLTASERGHGEVDGGQYEKEEEIFGVSAGAGLYKKKALEICKLTDDDYFDSDYFAYYEDVDLAWRMKMAGFKAIYCPAAIALHMHSATAKNYSAFKMFYAHRNYFLTVFKILSPVWLVLFVLYIPVRYFLLAWKLLRGKGSVTGLVRQEGGGVSVKLILSVWLDIFRNAGNIPKKRKYYNYLKSKKLNV